MSPATLEEQLAASIEWAKQRKAAKQRKEAIPMQPKVEFKTNIWETIALRYTEGKNMQNQFGESVMFSTVDNRVLFLPVPGAEKVRALNLNPGGQIAVRKAEVANGDGKPKIIWEVRRINGEQPNGTLAVKKETATVSPAAAPATHNANDLQSNGNTPAPVQDSALLRETKMLVDALAAAKNYSAQFNGLIAADDVRTLLLSAYITLSKGGRQ